MAVDAIGAIGTYQAPSPVGATTYNTNYTNGVATYQQLQALQDIENDLLNVGNTSTTNSADSASSSLAFGDLLNLSPAALNILNGIETADTNTSATSTTALPVGDTLINGALSPLQENQAAAIIAEYAGSPATSQTFTNIQNALSAAGINPQQISIQELIAAFVNSGNPVALFPLNGELLDGDLADQLGAAA